MTAVADVIVVGSGPAGMSVTWPLVQAGLRVVLTDPGVSPVSLPAHRPGLAKVRAGHADKADFLLGPDLRALRPGGHPSPKLRVAAPPDFVSAYLAAQKIETRNFVLAGTLASGGLSNVWGSVASVFDAADLAGMPVTTADMEISYRRVAARIGISGILDDDMGAFHGDVPLQRPIENGFLAHYLIERYRRHGGHALRLGRSRNAVLSQSHAGRDGCELDGYCMWGCRRKAVYNAAHEIPALAAFGNFTHAPGCLVERVERTGDVFRVSGRNPATGEPVSLAAARVVIAAGTVASTRIVLPMLGLSGRSRPLLTNPAYSFVLLMPGQLGRAAEKRGFAMSQLSYSLPLGAGGGYSSGLLYTAEGLSPADLAEQMPLSLRGGLALTRSLTPAIMLGLGYFDGSHSDNRITVDDGIDGATVSIEGGWAPGFDRTLARTGHALAGAFARIGAIMLPGSFNRLAPGGDSHYAGTLGMGDLLTENCEVKGINGLYVVDGAAFGRLPAKHFTLGIMANADRVGLRIAA